jgi:amino acid transporter
VGIDHYLPRVLGRVHPRYQTPYVALIAFAALSAILILMSNLGASVSEAYLTLLAISVVLQLIPNVYMFAALLKLARHRRFPSYRRKYMVSNGASGLGASSLGICLAFVPSDATTHVWAYEAKMIGAISLVLIVALVLYLRAQRGIRADAEAAARAMNGDSLVKLTDLS